MKAGTFPELPGMGMGATWRSVCGESQNCLEAPDDALDGSRFCGIRPGTVEAIGIVAEDDTS